MICTKCNQELPDDTKTCPYCGFQLQKKHPSQEKAAPDDTVLDSTNKTEKQFAEELKSKIKKSFYIKKDFNEAMNYIDLYLSMIGVDAEVIDYQQKILSTVEQKEEPEEINSKEGLFELELETELSPPEDKPNHSNQQEPLPDKEALSLDSEEEISELEDGLSTADEFEKESDFADKIVDDKSPVSDEKSWKQDEKDDRDDGLLVLGPEEEIFELEENTIEPDKSAAEKPDTSDKKDAFSQFEMEINEPDKKKQSDIIPGEIPVSEFNKDMLLVPDSQPVKESEFELQNQVEPGNIQSGTTDSVQTILNDLKEKKKKAFRWLFIGLSVIAFIILIIVLYILNAHSKNKDQPELPPPKTQEISKEMNEDQGLSPLGKQYLEYLRSANDYFRKDDLKNAKHMINLAKEIKITDELVNLEKELKNKKAEQEIIKKIDSDDPIQPDNTEEIAFQKAINSTNIIICQKYLQNYPAGKNAFEVRKRIKELRKQDRRILDQQLDQKLRLHNKKQLRTVFLSLTDQETKDIPVNIKNIPAQIENRLIEGNRVIIDYTFGLMWHHWDKTMNFKKAKWWANRRHAGYHNWRLPTAEEAATLSAKTIKSIITLSGGQYEIWTGDVNSLDSSQAWVYSPLSREFKSIQEDRHKHFWSVRVIKRKGD